jgi:hypothetical protein
MLWMKKIDILLHAKQIEYFLNVSEKSWKKLHYMSKCILRNKQSIQYPKPKSIKVLQQWLVHN